MTEFIGTKTREYKSGNNAQTGTLAKGEYFDAEFDQLYGNDNHLDSAKVERSGDTITGDFTVNGITRLKGGVIIEGDTSKINVSDTEISDNIVTLNKGETGAGVTKGTAGIEVDRGTLPSGRVTFNEADDSWYAGIVGALKKLAADECLPPIGSVIAHLPGYFTSSANVGYTGVSITLSARWKLCDGSALNDSESPIFNGSGRYLPNLTDSRFLMGSNTPGGIGGQNSFSISASNLPPHTHIISHDHGGHTHTGTTDNESAGHTHSGSTGTESVGHTHSGTTGSMNSNVAHAHGFSNLQGISAGVGGGPIVSEGTQVPSPSKTTDSTNINHTHNFSTGDRSAAHTHGFTTGGVSASHTHSFTSNSTNISHSGSSGDGGFANSAIENRPLYLACKYIMRIK